MKLADHQGAQDRIQQLLVDAYGAMMQDGLSNLILSQCGKYESALIEEAILRHISDITPANDGPAGRFPPSIAQILSQVHAIEMEARRQRNEERQQQISKESDQTYRTAVLGEGPMPEGRAGFWCKQIRHQIARAEEIRKAMELRYRLDYLQDYHRLLLMKTLERAVYQPPEESFSQFEHGQYGNKLAQAKVGLLPMDRLIPIADELARDMGFTVPPSTKTFP